MTPPSYDKDNLIDEYGSFIRAEIEGDPEFYSDLFVEAFRKELIDTENLAADGFRSYINIQAFLAAQPDQEKLEEFFSKASINVTIEFNSI